jgi:nitrogen-specific signal transduction histidine kinase
MTILGSRAQRREGIAALAGLRRPFDWELDINGPRFRKNLRLEIQINGPRIRRQLREGLRRPSKEGGRRSGS